VTARIHDAAAEGWLAIRKKRGEEGGSGRSEGDREPRLEGSSLGCREKKTGKRLLLLCVCLGRVCCSSSLTLPFPAASTFFSRGL
jgi:hypothetical protein